MKDKEDNYLHGKGTESMLIKSSHILPQGTEGTTYFLKEPLEF